MAILKIISHNKTTAGTRRLLSYVLDPNKTTPQLCSVSGDFRGTDITPQSVYRNYARVRELFKKERSGGRICTHGTVSFAPGEISPEQAADLAEEFVARIYPNHQVLTATHTDTDNRIHFHFIVHNVSCVDGSMLHTSKRDLEQAKRICNEMCQERGLSVAQKGRHADGSAFSPGEISAWDKNKYHQMVGDPKKSWLVDLAAAVKESLAVSCSKEDFCSRMEHEHGWKVMLKDSKKNITFIDKEGHRARDSNLNKSFHLDISKETLEQRYAQQRTATATHSGRRR